MMYVAADHYAKMKEEYREMGYPMEMMPVDLNGAYVSLEVTKESKDSQAELEKANHCTKHRFGLE